MKRLILLLLALLVVAACADPVGPTRYEGCVHAVLADGGEICL